MTVAYPDGQRSTVEVVTESTPSPFWEQGYLAFFDGAESDANPYPLPGSRAAEWDAGWAAAVREFKAAGPTEFDIELGEVVG